MVTKKPARKGVYLRKPAAKAMAFTRHVTLNTAHKSIWGKPRRWDRHADILSNVRDALKHALSYLAAKQIGTIVYVVGKNGQELIPIFECKWGNDNIPYKAFKNNPVAGWWRRKLTEAKN